MIVIGARAHLGDGCHSRIPVSLLAVALGEAPWRIRWMKNSLSACRLHARLDYPSSYYPRGLPSLMSKDGRRSERDGEWGELSYRTGRPTSQPPVRRSLVACFLTSVSCVSSRCVWSRCVWHPSRLATRNRAHASTFIPTDDERRSSRRLLFNVYPLFYSSSYAAINADVTFPEIDSRRCGRMHLTRNRRASNGASKFIRSLPYVYSMGI